MVWVENACVMSILVAVLGLDIFFLSFMNVRNLLSHKLIAPLSTSYLMFL